MAMVRALQQQAIYADPVVYDWPRIKARTLVIGGEKDGPNFPAQAKRVADTVQNGQLYLIPTSATTRSSKRPTSCIRRF